MRFLARTWPGCWASGAPPARPTRRWLARCGCSSWTAGCRCARGCPASASWPRRSASAARRRPPRTPRCATRAFSRRGGARAPGRGCPRIRRASREHPAPAGGDVIDLSCAACAAPEGALHAALAAATVELPRHLPGPGLRRGRAAGAARRDRRAPDVPRRADRRRAGARHQRRAARLDAAAARARRPRRPRPDRAPDLPGGARRRARDRRAARAGADARRRLGPRHARGDAAPGRAAARVRDRRPPEPDRAHDAGAGARAARGARARVADAAGDRRDDRRPAPGRRRRRRCRWRRSTPRATS